MSHLSIWLVRVCPDEPFVDLYPPERMAYLHSIRNASVRAQSYAAWRALLTGLREGLGLDPERLRFERLPNGKPCCDGAFFSLTHTDDRAAAAVSDCPVGLDMEHRDRFRGRDTARLRARIAAPGEQIPEPELPLYWTRKEALYKRGGDGAFVPEQLHADRPCLHSLVIDRYPELLLSVCSDTVDPPALYTPDESSASELTYRTLHL